MTAGLARTWVRRVVLTQPLMSAVAATSGTNARRRRARVELPQNMRSGHCARLAAEMMATPQRKKPHAVESATGMKLPPYKSGVPYQ